MYKYLDLLFLITNLVLIIINFYFLLFNEKTNSKIHEINSLKEIQIRFKVSDNFILKLIMNNYVDISNYLNNKYIYKINDLLKTKLLSIIKYIFHRRRKKIVLYSVDLFSIDYHKMWLKNLLKDKFIIKFDKNNPDYLLYNVFGSEHLNQKYNNSIKIAILTENKIPDFNEADYTIGHYHINYLDRYFKFSIFLWQNLNNKFFLQRRNFINSFKRINFCAALISNNISTDGFRLKFINELNKYKKVDMGGKYNNNIGKSVINKIEFLTSYKFSIAMENSEGDGYISEKIVESFLAGTIPIYYGDYMIDEYINPNSFILIKSEKDILKKIEYIKKIDQNNTLYKNLLNEKILLDNNIQKNHQKELKDFLYNIFQQDKSKAFRKFY